MSNGHRWVTSQHINEPRCYRCLALISCFGPCNNSYAPALRVPSDIHEIDFLTARCVKCGVGQGAGGSWAPLATACTGTPVAPQPATSLTAYQWHPSHNLATGHSGHTQCTGCNALWNNPLAAKPCVKATPAASPATRYKYDMSHTPWLTMSATSGVVQCGRCGVPDTSPDAAKPCTALSGSAQALLQAFSSSIYPPLKPGQFLVTIDDDTFSPENGFTYESESAGHPPCVECNREWCDELDAYYGRDPEEAAKCAGCRK